MTFTQGTTWSQEATAASSALNEGLPEQAQGRRTPSQRDTRHARGPAAAGLVAPKVAAVRCRSTDARRQKSKRTQAHGGVRHSHAGRSPHAPTWTHLRPQAQRGEPGRAPPRGVIPLAGSETQLETDSRSVVAGGGPGIGGDCDGLSGLLWGRGKLSSNQTVLMVLQPCKYTKNHWSVHLKR